MLLLKIFLFSILTLSLSAKNYNNNKKTKRFIDEMVNDYNFKRSYLQKLFTHVKVQKTPLKIFTRKKKVSTPSLQKKYPLHGAWDRYVKYKVTSKRITQGVSFLKKYRSTFKKVEKEYGIPAEYIAAIIGVESVYGGNVGNYPVFDTLATLAFEENRRSSFFRKELQKFIQLSFKQKFNPKNIKGSYAGAIGLGQFMPSSYEAYGIDFNKDGKVSLQHPQDAIASIAYYLKENGWRKGEEVATRVSYKGTRFKEHKTGYNTTYNRKDLEGIKPKLKQWNYKNPVRLIKLSKHKYDELWYAAKNFYVITRYNHSAYYAMTVHQLATSIEKKFKN